MTLSKVRRRCILSYVFCALAPVLVFFWRCQGSWDLRLPFGYAGDLLGLGAFVKTLLRGDWFPFMPVRSASLGAPFGGYNLGDYPTPEHAQYLLIKFLGLFSSDTFWVMNVYFILSFALIGVAARWAFRRIGASIEIATAAACLYAVLPYHFSRYAHLLLANYAALPFTLPPLLWMWNRKPTFFRRRPDGAWALDLQSRRARLTIAIALLVGAWHIYYAFFFAGFLVVAGVSAGISRRSWTHALSAGLAAGVVTASLSFALAPNIIYRKRNPPNDQRVATRVAWEVEQWGLQLTNITLPRGDHRVKAFRKAKARYQGWPSPVEGWEEYIGTFGVFGLGVLFIAGMSLPRRRTTLLKLAVLTLGGILFATRSGFSSHFSMYVSPQMRSVNRISVYLALFAFAATALWLQSRKTLRRPAIRWVVVTLLLAWGIYDQVSPGFVYTDSQRARYESDHAFISEIEKKMPPNSVVLQLPYFPFPESPPIENLGDYGHFRAYVHSQTLRWSYGAMKGRPAAWRIEELSRFPLDLAKLREAGYAGIYIDRNGFADKAVAIEGELKQKLHQAPLVSSDGVLLFFTL